QTALARDLLIAPVATTREVVENRQLADRGYWRALAHPELGRSITYPGPFARLGVKPIQYRRRPPTLGEHNHEIYGELGLGADAHARDGGSGPTTDAALADVKVVDLMWAIAGPAATRVLADYGATVVRIE